MMLKNYFRIIKKSNSLCSKRAIATIVTSAIILSSVSILGVFMLAWSNTSFLQQKMEIEEVFSTQMNKINEDLIFENVWFGTTPSNYLNVTLTNIGNLGMNVTEMKFYNSTDLSELASFSYSDGGIVVHDSYSTNATYAWTSGQTINIIVFTERENQFTTHVGAP